MFTCKRLSDFFDNLLFYQQSQTQLIYKIFDAGFGYVVIKRWCYSLMILIYILFAGTSTKTELISRFKLYSVSQKVTIKPPAIIKMPPITMGSVGRLLKAI